MFPANFGGTDIATPLVQAIDLPSTSQKRIFILTDGAVKNPIDVINAARNDKCSVHTVGIGEGCDEDMLRKTALSGRGSCSLIKDAEHEGVLNGKVVTALQYAMEPAMENCSIKFGTQIDENLSAVFRNQLIHKVALMSEDEFNQNVFKFYCQKDPQSGGEVI